MTNPPAGGELRVSSEEQKKRWSGWGERLLMGAAFSTVGFPGLADGGISVSCALPEKADLLVARAEKMLRNLRAKEKRRAAAANKKELGKAAAANAWGDVGARVALRNSVYENKRALQERSLPSAEQHGRRLERLRERRVQEMKHAVPEHVSYPVCGRSILPKKVPWVDTYD